MDKKISRHEWKSNLLPALIMAGPVTLVLVFLVAVPLVYVGVMSFCSIDEYYNVVFKFSTENYVRLLNADYLKIYGQSLVVALITTVLCILIGYPFSYLIARTKSKRKTLLYMLVIIPFWTNSLIRIYGWRTFLGTNGWLNELLQFLHLTGEPVDFLFKQGDNSTWYGLLPGSVYDSAALYGNRKAGRQPAGGVCRPWGTSLCNVFPGDTAPDFQRDFFREYHGIHSMPGILLCGRYSGRRKFRCYRKPD